MQAPPRLLRRASSAREMMEEQRRWRGEGGMEREGREEEGEGL